IATVGKALNSIFNVRCAPPTTVIPAQGAQLQSICQDETCLLAPEATCAAYPATMKPAKSNSTMMSNGTMSGSGSASKSGSMSATSTHPSSYTGAAAKVGAGAAGVLALAALAL
ncbi:hypothetical protein KCU71_g13383, partial [Aureobasidium melanogenum]